MFLKIAIPFLCLAAEIALGIYMYFNFENLLVRFAFYVFTALLVAIVVVKLAGPVENDKTANKPVEEPLAGKIKAEKNSKSA